MNKVLPPLAVLMVISSTLSAEELPLTVLPPLSAESEQMPEPATQDTQDFGIELPPVDASVLKAAQQQLTTTTNSTTSVAPQHIQIKPGINELMPIAVGHLNRLITPFDNPVVTTTSQATTSTQGKIVYVATADETPVTLYITPGDNQDIALSLTLIPKRIPAREIHLSLDKDSLTVLRKLQQQTQASNYGVGDQEQAYIAQLKKLFRELGLQRTPPGFSLREPTNNEHIQCLQDSIQIKTGQVLEGQDMLILVGLARNTGLAPLEFDERACATTHTEVLAVAAWPKVVLGQNEATELYVAIRRSADASVELRPSLLSGGQR
jgi:conjugal transfer pilus assembly protein TraK